MSAAYKSECPGGTGQSATNQNTDTADFNADRYATQLIAKLEQAGHTVRRLEHGYLAAHCNLTLHCPDLAALVRFSRQLGVLQ